MLVSQRRTGPDRTQAAHLFGRVLAPWAMDIMRLRRAGLDRPTARRARRLLALPGDHSGSLAAFEPLFLDAGLAARLLRTRAAPIKVRRAA